MKIRDLGKFADIEIQTARPEESVHDAIQRLVQFNIGALPVCDDSGRVVGIISERDVLRLCSRDDAYDTRRTLVEEVMTKDVVIGVPSDDLDYVMHVMTERHIRHLPVFDQGKLVRIVSIGDVVKARLDASETEIRYMRDYVSGVIA